MQFIMAGRRKCAKNRCKIAVAWLLLLTFLIPSGQGDAAAAFPQKSPVEYLFWIQGNPDPFILLDTDENGALVMPRREFGQFPYDRQKRTRMILTDLDNILYFLNNRFLTVGNDGAVLPPEVVQHIDRQRSWDGITCGISLLSQSQAQQYAARIGYQDDMPVNPLISSTGYWWLRNGTNSCYAVNKKNGNVVTRAPAESAGLRPVFYLDQAFFRSVKLETENMGSAVRAWLRDVFAAEVPAVYSADELADIRQTNGDVREELQVTVDGYDVLNRKLAFLPEEIQFTATVTRELINRKSSVRNFTIRYFRNGIEVGADKFFTTGVGTVTKTFRPENVPYGVHQFDAVLYSEDIPVARVTKELAVMKPYEQQPMQSLSKKGFSARVGVTEASAQKDIDAVLDTGSTMLRTGREWRWVERQKGSFDFGQSDAKVTPWLKERDNCVYLLAYHHDLYSGRAGKPNSDKYGIDTKESMDAFARYAAAVAKRYPEIQYFEIWNEPNGQTTGFWLTDVLSDNPNDTAGIRFEDYCYLLEVTYTAIKQVRPDAIVCAGSLAGADVTWIRQLYEHGAYAYFDCLTIHPYIDLNVDENYRAKFAETLQYIQKHGGWKPVAVTEVGFSSYQRADVRFVPKTEEQIAAGLVKVLTIGDESGFLFQTLYTNIDSGEDKTNSEHRFGVMGVDYAPKPQFISVKEQFERTAGAVYIGNVPMREGVDFHLYLKNGQPLAIAWSTDGEQTLEFDTQQIACFDLYGNLQSSGNCVAIGETPVYLYGFSEEFCQTAFLQVSARELENLKQQYPAMELTVAAQALLAGDAADAADVIYQVGRTIAGDQDMDDSERYAMLYGLHRLGERLLLWNAHQTNANEVTPISPQRLQDIIGQMERAQQAVPAGKYEYLPALLLCAERLLGDIETLSRESGAAIQARRCALEQSVAYLLDWAEALLSSETIGHSGVLFFVPSASRLFFNGVSNQIEVAVYNTTIDSLDGTLELYNADGRLVGEQAVSLKAGETKRVPLEFLRSETAYNYTLKLRVGGMIAGVRRVSANTARDSLITSPGDTLGRVYEQPYCSELRISGDAIAGQTLLAQYTIHHSMQDGGTAQDGSYAFQWAAPQDNSVIEWQCATTKDGAFLPVGTGTAFVVPQELRGKYLRFRVLPKMQIPVTITHEQLEEISDEWENHLTGLPWYSQPVYIPAGIALADIVVRDAENLVVTEVTGGQYTLETRIISDRDACGCLVLAMYQKGQLIDVTIEAAQFFSKGEIARTVSFAVDRPVELKLMLWENTETIHPLAEAQIN